MKSGVVSFDTRSHSTGAIAAVLLVATLAGCGYVGDPRPPSLGIPYPPEGFSARQVGAEIQGSFATRPDATDNAPLRSLDAVVRVGGREIPLRLKPGERGDFRFNSAEWSGQTVTVAARLRGPTGRWSEWSAEAQLDIVAPLPPAAATATATARGIELRWTPAGPAEILREANEGTLEVLAQAPEPPYLDSAVAPGGRYGYLVVRRASAAENAARAAASNRVLVAYEDKFPPAVPAGLDAVAGITSIELSWDLNEDPDLAGFVIYRAQVQAAAPADFRRLAGPISLPSFSDRTITAGATYRYAVAAIDRAGNESARSTPIEIQAPEQ